MVGEAQGFDHLTLKSWYNRVEVVQVFDPYPQFVSVPEKSHPSPQF